MREFHSGTIIWPKVSGNPGLRHRELHSATDIGSDKTCFQLYSASDIRGDKMCFQTFAFGLILLVIFFTVYKYDKDERLTIADLCKENERIRGLNDSLQKKTEGVEETVKKQDDEIESLRANASGMMKEVEGVFDNLDGDCRLTRAAKLEAHRKIRQYYDKVSFEISDGDKNVTPTPPGECLKVEPTKHKNKLVEMLKQFAKTFSGIIPFMRDLALNDLVGARAWPLAKAIYTIPFCTIQDLWNRRQKLSYSPFSSTSSEEPATTQSSILKPGVMLDKDYGLEIDVKPYRGIGDPLFRDPADKDYIGVYGLTTIKLKDERSRLE